MGDARNAFALQKGRLAHQRPGGEQQNPAQLPLGQPRQNVGRQHGGAAPGPTAAGLHLLAGPVIEKQAAVLMVLQG